MSGSKTTGDQPPQEIPPKKYYWPWECTYSRDSFRFGLRTLFLFMMSVAVVSCYCGLVVRHTEGKNLSGTEANRRLSLICPFVRVPDGASNVELYATRYHAKVGFDVDFAEFSALCRSREWALKPIDPKWPPFAFDVDGKPLNIANGYIHNGSTNRGGFDAYYDSDRGRAWIYFSMN